MFEYIRSNYSFLTTSPATDGNFKSALNRATDEELARAYDHMAFSDTWHNKSRLAAVNREIKRRAKQ